MFTTRGVSDIEFATVLCGGGFVSVEYYGWVRTHGFACRTFTMIVFPGDWHFAAFVMFTVKLLVFLIVILVREEGNGGGYEIGCVHCYYNFLRLRNKSVNGSVWRKGSLCF